VIITRTPFRISFAGGGTDLPSFYRKYGGGAVASAAIDRYIHVLVNEKFDASIRVAYSKTENVDRLDQLEHELVREALRMVGLEHAVEVHTIADIPGEGTGIGSSSSLTVGLLNALYAFEGKLRDPEQLAEEACRIEIDLLRGTLGKQDQYTAAFGGVHYFEFRPDDSVRVLPIPLSPKAREDLGAHLSLFYTGVTRKARHILVDQDARTAANRDALLRMRDLAGDTRDALIAHDWVRVGEILDEGWQFKKRLADGITNGQIEEAYAKAKGAGAIGGKVTGAGGGGFLLVFHPPERAPAVEESLKPMRRVPIGVSPDGSQLLVVRR
jgi:D-glycero-alpha-D-manno-heptose-7-phosphate kinase